MRTLEENAKEWVSGKTMAEIMLVSDATDSLYIVYSGIEGERFSVFGGLEVNCNGVDYYTPFAGAIKKIDFPELKDIIPWRADIRTEITDKEFIKKILSKVE